METSRSLRGVPFGFWMVKEYRDAYGMFAVNGILFNHESERRGENFVTRKITLAAGRIAEGLQDHLELGNMDSLRDWGYAKDYVECMWLIMQQEKPEDFVIATGVQHTVRDFTEKAFAANGMTIRWEGTGIDEKGYDAATGKMLVCVNPQWFRPTDVDNLWGDPTKAKTVLGWNPQKTSYEELVEIMAKNDRELTDIFCIQSYNFFEVCNVTSSAYLPHTSDSRFNSDSSPVM